MILLKSDKNVRDSPDPKSRGQKQGTLPKAKTLTKFDILKIFFPQKFRPLAFREYFEKKAIGRSYFYRLVDELEQEGYLFSIGGSSPREFKVTTGALERLSLLSGMSASEGKLPEKMPGFSGSKKLQQVLHNILFVLDIRLPPNWITSQVLKEGWTINAKGTNLINISPPKNKFNAQIQFFTKTVLIRLENIIGSNAYVNQVAAMDAFNSVVEMLRQALPKVTFYTDVYKYAEIPANPPMMEFEIGIPNHPIPVHERKIGVKHYVYKFDKDQSEFYSDNSPGRDGPELDIKGKNKVQNAQRLYESAAFECITGVGVPELLDKQFNTDKILHTIKTNILDIVENQSLVTAELNKNKETLDYILVQDTKAKQDQFLKEQILNQKINNLMGKKSLFARIKSMVQR